MPDPWNGKLVDRLLPGWLSRNEVQFREWPAAAKDAASRKPVFERDESGDRYEQYFDTVRQSSRDFHIGVNTTQTFQPIQTVPVPKEKDGLDVHFIEGKENEDDTPNRIGTVVWKKWGSFMRPSPKTGDEVRYAGYGGKATVNGESYGLVGLAFTDRKPRKLVPGWRPPRPGDEYYGYPYSEYGVYELADLDYLTYGIWMLADEEGTTHEVGVAVSGNPIYFNVLRDLRGTATYTGGAIGTYFIEQNVEQNTENSIAPFTGDVTLTANFAGHVRTSPLSTLGTIRGVIGNIKDRGGNFAFNVDGTGDYPGGEMFGLPASFTLGETEILHYRVLLWTENSHPDGNPNLPHESVWKVGNHFHEAVSATDADGHAFTGKWGGKFFGVPTTSADQSKAYPGRVGGTFAAHSSAKISGVVGRGYQLEVTGRSVIGVFGTKLEK